MFSTHVSFRINYYTIFTRLVQITILHLDTLNLHSARHTTLFNLGESVFFYY